MNQIESLTDLSNGLRDALVIRLCALADNELIQGHRASEWTGHGPILEEDIAFSSIAQDEIGHARVFYQMLHDLGEKDPDTLAFERKPREYRCASLVTLPNNRDWAFSVLRQFLYDSAESVRLAALCESRFTPLAQLARKILAEEKYHLAHGRLWVLRLGRATTDSQHRMAEALKLAYPHALRLFEPTATDEHLAQAEIWPTEEDLRRQWESSVAPVLSEAGLDPVENGDPAHSLHDHQHLETLTELLNDMRLVYNIDPNAKW